MNYGPVSPVYSTTLSKKSPDLVSDSSLNIFKCSFYPLIVFSPRLHVTVVSITDLIVGLCTSEGRNVVMSSKSVKRLNPPVGPTAVSYTHLTLPTKRIV